MDGKYPESGALRQCSLELQFHIMPEVLNLEEMSAPFAEQLGSSLWLYQPAILRRQTIPLQSK
jgi:hypothetical protein